MKNLVFASAMIVLMVAVSAGVSYAQQGSTGGQGGWYNCPMMGPGRATGPGGWYCPWMRGHHGNRYGSGGPLSYNQGGEPLTKDQAEQLLRDHIEGNPNLKVGDFEDKGGFYEGTI